MKFLQQTLGLTADGDFGSQTDGAVKSFQRSGGLTDDGVVGGRTWGALVGRPTSRSAIRPPPPASAPSRWSSWSPTAGKTSRRSPLRSRPVASVDADVVLGAVGAGRRPAGAAFRYRVETIDFLVSP